MKLIDYIQGKRHGKGANRLEREALNDPFLRDAMEGFDAVSGDHLASINQLEEDLKRRTRKKTRVISYRWWTIGLAASLILVLGIGSLMRLEMRMPKDTAQRAPNIIIPSKTKSDSIVRVNEVPEKKTIAQNITKPKAVKNTEAVTAVEKVKSYCKNDSQKLSDMTTEIVPPATVIDGMSLKSHDSIGIKNISTTLTAAIQGRVAGVAVKTNNSGYSKSSKNKQGKSELATLNKLSKISGKVVDENGEPMIGVNVRIKGSSNATVTDVHGNFELNGPINNKMQLETGYIGYETKEVALTDNLNEIKLQPSAMAMNEVVVIGYGTVKKSDLTGAVASIRSDKPFGETEFKTYYQKHLTGDLCNMDRLLLKVSFRIDSTGKPTDIKVDKAPCLEMEQEFIKCLQNSPTWTLKNRKVRMTIRF